VLQIRKTHVYAEWIDNLRDLQGRVRGFWYVWKDWLSVTLVM